jgi:hypothetical protein
MNGFNPTSHPDQLRAQILEHGNTPQSRLFLQEYLKRKKMSDIWATVRNTYPISKELKEELEGTLRESMKEILIFYYLNIDEKWRFQAAADCAKKLLNVRVT